MTKKIKFLIGSIGLFAAAAITIGSVISCSSSNNTTGSSNSSTSTDNSSSSTKSTLTVEQPTSNQAATGIYTSSSLLEVSAKISSSGSNIKNTQCLWNVNGKSLSSLLSDNDYTSGVNDNTATLKFSSNAEIAALLNSLNITNSTTLSFTVKVTANSDGASISSSESAPLDIQYIFYDFTAIPTNTNTSIKTLSQANSDWNSKWSSYTSAQQKELTTQYFNGKFNKILQAHNEEFTSPRAFPYAKSSISGWTYTEEVFIESATISPIANSDEYNIEIIMQAIYSTSKWSDFATVTETLNIDGAKFTSEVISGSNYGETGYYGGLALNSYTNATLSIGIQYSTQPTTITDIEFSDIKDSMGWLAPTYTNKQIPQSSSEAKELMANADIIIANADGINYGSLSNN